MQPFQLPDFYVPHPARLNPNLAGARTHSKAWAEDMDILGSAPAGGGPAIWDEARFDAMDYALLCAAFRGPTGLGTGAAAVFARPPGPTSSPVARPLVGIGVVIDD